MPGAATAFPVLLPRCDRSCHGLRRLALRVSCASRTAGALGNSPAARTTLAIPPAVPRGSASPSRPWPGSRNSASGHSGKGEAPARNPASWSFRTAHSADPESRKGIGHGGHESVRGDGNKYCPSALSAPLRPLRHDGSEPRKRAVFPRIPWPFFQLHPCNRFIAASSRPSTTSGITSSARRMPDSIASRSSGRGRVSTWSTTASRCPG